MSGQDFEVVIGDIDEQAKAWRAAHGGEVPTLAHVACSCCLATVPTIGPRWAHAGAFECEACASASEAEREHRRVCGRLDAATRENDSLRRQFDDSCRLRDILQAEADTARREASVAKTGALIVIFGFPVLSMLALGAEARGDGIMATVAWLVSGCLAVFYALDARRARKEAP